MQLSPLFADEYLFSHFESEFQTFAESRDAEVLQHLVEWDRRDKSLGESQLNGQFIQKFFHDLWQYWGTGAAGADPGYSLLAEYAVSGAGQLGGTGKADLAMGHFGTSEMSDVPQVLCEFKHINSGLDSPQSRKGNNRSPVQQCLDYLKNSFDKAPVNSPVVPSWGLVTDMNEFRLYYRKLGAAQYQRFAISSDGNGPSLLHDTESGARQRFIFCKLFSYESLIARTGTSPLEQLLQRQWTHEKALEKDFYREYQTYRQHVYQAILDANPSFEGTRGDLVRMTQRFLDRCIFLLFCEDMGSALQFPVHLLRDILVRESCSPSYSAEFDNIWSLVKQLFHTMRDGGPFPPSHRIHKFNGGLFADLVELERLRIPNRVFCAHRQGESRDQLGINKNTLLYLSATYNFGNSSKSHERSITLYTLGRIFEQSITDLEYMHADAEGEPTIASLSKRKRDGVYYTPEWVTSYLVEQVLGRRLAKEREELGLVLGIDISADALTKYRRAKTKPKTNPATLHIQRLDNYESFLDRMTVLDPACGSGAFLIQSLQFLQKQRRDLAIERERITGHPSLFDQESIVRSILSKNLFGVDINPESVEITQLALWLHTATPGKPLSTLDKNIRCGNSLVEKDFGDFYQTKHSTLFDKVDRKEQEKVNAFDWATNFPLVLGSQVDPARRGFDCIVGNPPYVKLQHFRKVVPDVSEYLVHSRINGSNSETTPRYRSTQKKNFDLYLPFIERGISLLNSKGHMGYIAPSVWLLNEYGEGLKEWLVNSHSLERWVDFKDFPVFEEAMTYTALQFYTRTPVEGIAFASASNGELASVQDEGFIRYESLDPTEAWVFLPDRERQLINRLNDTCTRLIDHPHVKSIFQGVITSADHIYHFEKLSNGRYRHFPPKQDPEEILLEDAIMRPLLSGTEAKRYQSPQTNTYLLFPYDDSIEGRPVLYDASTFASRFPNAWKHLSRYETELRGRENKSFDDDSWYRFGRNQNIEKQRLSKLGVAQTVPEMRVFYDSAGEFCLNNVRVNGILVDDAYAWFILGLLNARVADFVFRRLSKPKEPRPSGAYFEANKQYIAPIPIPTADSAQRDKVAALAMELQGLHSSRRAAIENVQLMLASDQMRDEKKKPSWIWADVRTPEDWESGNPEGLAGRNLRKWAKDYHQQLLDMHLSDLDARISFGQPMYVTASDGQLKLFIGNRCAVQVYVGEIERKVILPQWRDRARDTFVSESMDAKRIVNRLLELKTTDNSALIEQLWVQTVAIEQTEGQIVKLERELDDLSFELYGLSDEEITIVEAATAQRSNARIPRPSSS